MNSEEGINELLLLVLMEEFELHWNIIKNSNIVLPPFPELCAMIAASSLETALTRYPLPSEAIVSEVSKRDPFALSDAVEALVEVWLLEKYAE